MTIRVSDQGGGIPRRMTDTLFEYLYTTAPTPAITSSVDLPGKDIFDLKNNLDYIFVFLSKQKGCILQTEKPVL